MASLLTRPHALPERRDPGRRPRWVAPITVGGVGAPVAVGVAAALVGVALSWVPSVWYDEAATVVSATRPWGELGREIRHVDVVHATFYSIMHVWFTLVGYSPLTLRLPSALAIGATAGLVVVLGRMLVDLRVGVLAGAFFAVMPRVTWMATEGRSFALGTLIAVAATIVFVAAHRRTTGGRRAWPWWVAYVVLSISGGAVFLYLVLVTVGHGVTVALPLLRRHARGTPARRAARSWTAAAALTLVAIVPLARAASTQSTQIDWIQHISGHTLEEVLVTQWFTDNPGFAVFGCAVAAGGAVVALRFRQGRALLAVAVPWSAVPTLGLIAASLVTNPLYSPRYVAFGAPAVALCMGAAAAAAPVRRVPAAVALAVIAAAALSAPTWVEQRTVTAKDDSAWNEVAALVGRERAEEPAGQDDAIVYGPVERHPLATSRIIAETYPAAFAGLRDPLLETPTTHADALWDSQRPLSDVVEAVNGARSVWLLTAVSPDVRSTVTERLAADGYHADGAWRRARTWIVRYRR